MLGASPPPIAVRNRQLPNAVPCRPVVSRRFRVVPHSADLKIWRIRVLATHLVLFACTALAGGGPSAREYLDEETGATVTLMSQPLVFAYARPDLAVNARDYVTLEAAAVNRSGKVTYVLIGYFWSTVDPRLREEPLATPDVLQLQADDRRIQLSTRGHTAHDAGIGMTVDAPPGAKAPNVYGTDLATLRFIGESRHLALVFDTERTTLSYDLFEDRRGALKGFVRHMSGAD